MDNATQLKRTPYKPNRTIAFARPAGKPAAALLFFHGGGWVGGDPMQFQQLWPSLLAANFICATVEYLPGPPRTVHRSLENAQAAVSRFANMFSTLPLFLCGASAGGTLALLASTGDFRGCILFNPVLDLSAKGFKGKAVPPEGDESMSPIHMGRNWPRTLIVQGDSDKTVPVEDAQMFSELNSAKLIVLRKTGHGFVNKPVHTERITNIIREFVRDNSGPAKKLR